MFTLNSSDEVCEELCLLDPLLDKDHETNNEISQPFLTNGQVNTFPWKQEAYNITVKMEMGVFYVVRAEELNRRQLGQ
jgi:hypothetical protein